MAWFTPGGADMTEQDWDAGYAKTVAVFLNGEAISYPDRRGQRVVDDSFLLLFNAAEEAIDFALPSDDYAERWEVVADTASPLTVERPSLKSADTVSVDGRSIMVLRRDV